MIPRYNTLKILLTPSTGKIQKINCPNEAYDEFLKTFSSCYEVSFPKVKIKIKSKSFLSPWITKGLIKSSKKKQKLYNNFLKHKTYKNEKKYKTYKNLFETLKLKSKKNYYAKLINKYKNNIKKTWQVIKEIIGKTKLISNNLPRRLIVNETEISDQKDIAKHFNEYSVVLNCRGGGGIKRGGGRNFKLS